MFEFPLHSSRTAKGLNDALKMTILDDKVMKAAGFSDRGSKWLIMRRVGDRKLEISLDIIIPKESPENFSIDVIDEDFGQPYDYQAILQSDPSCIAALRVWVDVEDMMKKLTAAGILSGHVFGEYI